MLDTNALDKALATNLSLTGLSDADAAASPAFAAVTTPRTDTVTATTLAATWGPAKAATVDQVLLAQIAAGQASGATVAQQGQGAEAQLIRGILYGPGFDPTNAVAQQLFASYVSAGVITQADANAILTVTTYPMGGPVAATDVTASRARIANRQKVATAQAAIVVFKNATDPVAGLANLKATIASL